MRTLEVAGAQYCFLAISPSDISSKDCAIKNPQKQRCKSLQQEHSSRIKIPGIMRQELNVDAQSIWSNAKKVREAWCWWGVVYKLTLLQTRKLRQTARTFLLPLPAWPCELIKVDCDAMGCILQLYLSQLPPVNYSTSRSAVQKNTQSTKSIRSFTKKPGWASDANCVREKGIWRLLPVAASILSSRQSSGDSISSVQRGNLNTDPRKQASSCRIREAKQSTLSLSFERSWPQNFWTGLILGCCQSSDIAELEVLRCKQRTNDFAPTNGTWEFIAYRFCEDKTQHISFYKQQPRISTFQ